MHFLRIIRRLFSNGFLPIAGTAVCVKKMLFNAMSVRIFSSTIALSHFQDEMTKDGVICKPLSMMLWIILLTGMLILPGKSDAVVINNTALVNTNLGSIAASTGVDVPLLTTPSTVELLQYAPGPVPGSTSIAVPSTFYSVTGLPAGPFAPSDNPVAIDSTPIPMPGTVDLLPASSYKAGEPVFIRLTDADQNINPLVAETILVTVATAITGDSVVLQLTETGLNTGIFIGYVQSSSVAVTVNDDVISVGINELLNVFYVDASDGTDTSVDGVLVDPYGTLLSTTDGSPLDGGTVTIIDVGTGLPAVVFGDDGVSNFPSTVTSGGVAVDSGGNTYNFPAGGYRFPLVSPGAYRIDIIPPAGYSGPSVVSTATIQTLPGAPFSVVTGSRNENFLVNPGPALHIDIPLDSSATGLFISKKSMKNSVAIGEYLQYQLDVSNTSAAILTGASIVDVLPIGFRYESGSTRIDGVSVANPVVSADGRTLTFVIGGMPAASAFDLRYVVAVAAGSGVGEATNLASGSADGGIVSNTAQAAVTVVEDLMPSRSHLMGRVIAGGCSAADGDRGSVSLQLQSQAVKDFVDYTATVSVDVLSVNELSIVVNLPGTLEYVFGSGLRDDIRLIDPIVNGKRLIFKLGRGEKGSVSAISFRTRNNLNAFGEFSVRAYAEFEDPSESKEKTAELLFTPNVSNKVKDFSRIIRPRFDSLSATLKPGDLKELDELVQSLRGQDIRRIHIVGHTDNKPIRARSRSLYADNEALSKARAKSVGDYLQRSLGLKAKNIKISGMGDRKQLLYSERLRVDELFDNDQLSLNRRVEVLVELMNQSPESRFIISRSDSGVRSVDTLGPKGDLSAPGLATNQPGMSGVRLYLEDGRYVDTDDKGLYHFEGLKPGTHIVQVDVESIPDHMEVFSCEKDTRFSGTPHSQFIDLQGGSLWRADFYIRNKSDVALKGNVGLQLSSELLNEKLLYKVKIEGSGVVLQNRRLVVDLPFGAEYEEGSAMLDGRELKDGIEKDGQLIFEIESVDKTAWENTVTFTANQTLLSEGEFTSMAILMYEASDGKSHQSSEVENTLTRQADSERKMVYLGHYQGIETSLTDDDQIRLEGVIDYLRSKKIRKIEVVANNDNPPLAEKYRTRYEDNRALSLARAELIGSYISDSLGLYGQQIKRIGLGSDRVVTEDDDSESNSQNQRVEIFVTQANKKSRIITRISKSDSGMVKNSVIGASPTPDLEKEIEQNNNVRVEGLQGIVDGQRFSQKIIQMRVMLDSRLKVLLNIDGKPVDKDRIAMIMPNKETGKTVYSYIGVNLGKQGSHAITLEGMDPFGNARFSQTLNVVLTGEVHDIRIVETTGNIADGKSPVRIRVRLLDAVGEVIQAESDLRIVSGSLKPYEKMGTLPEDREREDIIKVDEQGYIDFAPVSSSGLRRVKLSYNDASIDISVYVKPDYREWIMVGLAEGTIGQNNLSGNIQNLESADINDEYYREGRLAFYTKGKILGKYLLTASYDSDKEKPDTANGLFGTIDPNKYYTLYGDATTVRYDAQSSEKLYLKIESDNFYAMFGDYNTGLTVTELGRYSRSLTGIKTEYQDEKVTVTAFASETRQAFVKDEIRGEGTSGLYRLSRQNIVLNSEKVSIETRDRFRGEVVLESRQLSRYIDYTFDPVDGTIYFREPIYSRDASFNPIYIVANYEVSAGAGKAITSGGRIAIRPAGTNAEFGATLLHEGTIGAEADLVAADVKYELNEKTTLKAEIATSSRKSGSNTIKGNAVIAEAITRTDKIDGKVYFRRQEGDFGLGQQLGSETATHKIGLDGSYKLNKRTAVNTEVFRQENLATDAVRDVVNANVEYKQDVYSISGGTRYARDKDGAGDTHESTLLTAAVKRSFMGNKLSLHASTEKAVNNDGNADYPDRFITGGEYRLTTNTRLFAEHEITRGENQDSSTSRAGLKATPWKGAALSSSVENQTTEYGPRIFANMGLTQGVRVNQFLKLDFGFEQVKTLRHPGDIPFNVNVPPASGTISDDFTAISTGATYKKKLWSLTARAERRDGTQEDKVGLLMGFYRQQTPGFGLAATAQYFDTERVTGLNNTSTNLEFSLAYRPIKSQWIVLNRSRFMNETARTVDGITRTRKLVNNLNANYLHDRDNQVSLTHGIKYVIDNFDGTEYSGVTNLFGTEYRHDLNHRWDVGAQASMLMSSVGNSYRYSWGVSIGHTLAKNLWVSVGVNIDGFTDDDFTSANYTASGVYAKFRFAFDHYTKRRVMAWWERK